MFIFDMIAVTLSQRIFGIDPHAVLDLENQIELNRNNVNSAKLYMGLVSFGSFILSSIIVISTFRKKLFPFTVLDKPPKLVNVLIGILLLITSIPLVNWLLDINRNIPIPSSTLRQFLEHQEELNNFTYDVILTGNTGIVVLLNIFLVGLLPALGEELFFRGIMLRIFKSLTRNIHLGVWLSAILFATLHIQVFKIVPMILLGALFGYVYYLSGSLWITIIMHFINNSIAVIIDHLEEPHTGANQMLSGQTWYYIALSVVLIAVLLFALKKYNPNPPDLQIE